MKIKPLLLLIVSTAAAFGISLKEFLYRKGVEFYRSGNYVGALEIFNYLGNYKSSAFYRKKLFSFFSQQPELGDIHTEPPIRIKIGEFKHSVEFYRNSGKIEVKASERGFKVFNKEVQSFEIDLEKPSRIKVDGKYYTLKGKLRLVKHCGRNLIILVLPLEEYLLHVLPSEVYPNWNIEALKAQAVASRTFALYNILKRKDAPYDVDSGTNFQVFNFSLKILPKVKEAVETTEGEVLTFQGRPIYAMFHSNSGGETCSFKELLGLNLPYLSAIRDPYSLRAPKWVSWKITISRERFKVFPFPVEDFKFTERHRGRVRFMELKTDKGTYKIPFTFTGRLLLKIPSNWCYKLGKNKGYWLIVGRGFGHCLGMSQWGAEIMAEEGKSYKEILKFYYRNTGIKKLY